MSGSDRRSREAEAYRHLYKTARWRAVRAQQLAAEPLCRMCLASGRITPATVCDHVDRAGKATEEGFFTGPFQSLCKPHHDAGKQREELAGYSAETDQHGWPTDPRHPANRPR